MTIASSGALPANFDDNDEISLLAIGSILLRRRRMIIALGLLGVALGLAAGLLATRRYVSIATFIPQGAEGATSGLALAASQLGIRVPASGGGWGPPIYVELLHSRAMLEPIANDTVVVAEEGRRRIALMDLLEIRAPNRALRSERAVRALEKIVTASEDKKLGAVRLAVTTKWPSVSLTLAQRLVTGVNRFNLQSRKSQATAERQFVEVQAAEAEQALRIAEGALQLFLQRNRVISGSPELGIERDRLQREVILRQQIFTSLLQSREEAKIREVRDTPVITVLEEPRLPAVARSRKTFAKALLGGLAGIGIALMIALLGPGMASARRAPSEEAREFFQLVEEATPRFLRRRRTRPPTSTS